MERILYLLSQYKYIVLLPLAIIEGPILAVIAGFLCTGGFLNLFIVYPIIVFGDIIGDSLCYMCGRWGVPKFMKRIAGVNLKPKNIDKVRAYFNSNPNKAISFSKIALGIGIAGIYLAGNSRVPYDRFIRICLLTSALQYIAYLAIGLIFGAAYLQISHYLNVFSSFTIIAALAVILFYFIQSIRKKI
jgi:membrane-associated protein